MENRQGKPKIRQIWVRALCLVSSVCFEVFIKAKQEMDVQFIPRKIINIVHNVSMCDVC